MDLIGPWADHELARERLPNFGGRVRPSTWYLTGFIVPSNAPPKVEILDDSEDELDEATTRAAPSEEAGDEGKTARKGYFPSSIGLSFQIDAQTRELNVTVSWGDYIPERVEGKPVWTRIPHKQQLDVRLPRGDRNQTMQVPESGGLVLHIITRSIHGFQVSGLENNRSVSIFLVNQRKPDSAGGSQDDDQTYDFQPEIEVNSSRPLPSKSIRQSSHVKEWDDEVADLHYADCPEYATGHGVSADWTVIDGQCRMIRTSWIGFAEVKHVETTALTGVNLSMYTLGRMEDGTAVHRLLDPLVEGYRNWIDQQLATTAQWGASKDTAEGLLSRARFAAGRMANGIDVLASQPRVLDAFKIANRAVARALEQRLGISNPTWRAFQLAFILLNIPGLANPKDKHRKFVDLLFFPTGGGKTEAYLGLAALAMVLRRLNHPEENGHAAGGISVIMRYTLRLLTLDQLSRAAGLICALELERLENPDRYGSWPFEIGLWVGMAATPNRMGFKGDTRRGTAREKVRQFQSDPSTNPAPIPLEECPWCATKFEPNSFQLVPNSARPRELRINCINLDCEFSDEKPLPIVAVDDSIFQRLPAFLIATVDKFASLPWTGESGILLGGADRYDEHGFYGPCNKGGVALPSPLGSPDLIIQDELHLISGPLGTMTGLYEVAIEELCVRNSPNGRIRPKIVASTATIRMARDQVQALFGRTQTQIFPPPGPDRRDSYFARTIEDPQQARLYLGIAAKGRNSKVVTRRVWVALMAAAMKAWVDAGDDANKDNPADPYMSLIGYFNSLRELGGGRRILEEEVQSTIRGYGAKKRFGEKRGLFLDRRRFSDVLELTSRVPTNRVAEARRKLGHPFRRRHPLGEEWSVDCAIATNMISVGLDIQRLGLMTVIGQPKTAAEYIQATSRVGRDTKKPGLVVTILNMYRPRDRSHYERFKHFHQTFYRAVEVASVTPFSARALDKGLAGALVALTRHASRSLTPPKGAARIRDHREDMETLLVEAFADRVRQQPGFGGDTGELEERLSSVRNRIGQLLDAWVAFQQEMGDGEALLYQRYEHPRTKQPLLRDLLEDLNDERRRMFRAGRSLRDVETEVRLGLLAS